MAEHEIVIRVVVEQPSAAAAPPVEEFTEVEGKTYSPSQLLRFAIYRAWVLDTTTTKFEDYYKRRMERIVEVIDKQTGK